MSAEDPPPRVAAVTVSWNDAPLALRALGALRSAGMAERDLIVVDNGSRSEQAAALREGLGSEVLVALKENAGYTGGFNAGIRVALEREADLIIFVNSDAVVAPGAIRALVDAAAARPDAALIGAVILVEGTSETILTAGGTLDKRLEMIHASSGGAAPDADEPPRSVELVSGCVVLVRAAMIPRLGLLDEDFFAYYEDVDWCLRAHREGMAVVIAPKARAWHPNTVRRDDLSAPVTYYMARNRLLLARKHARARYPVVMTQLLRTAASWTVRPRWRGKRAQRDALLLGIFDDLRGYRGSWQRPSPRRAPTILGMPLA